MDGVLVRVMCVCARTTPLCESVLFGMTLLSVVMNGVLRLNPQSQ